MENPETLMGSIRQWMGLRNEDPVEKCVICNTPTEYKQLVPIDFRNYYVEGAGQLCKECYERTYSKSGTI